VYKLEEQVEGFQIALLLTAGHAPVRVRESVDSVMQNPICFPSEDLASY
jgi:hypothetical protein